MCLAVSSASFRRSSGGATGTSRKVLARNILGTLGTASGRKKIFVSTLITSPADIAEIEIMFPLYLYCGISSPPAAREAETIPTFRNEFSREADIAWYHPRDIGGDLERCRCPSAKRADKASRFRSAALAVLPISLPLSVSRKSVLGEPTTHRCLTRMLSAT